MIISLLSRVLHHSPTIRSAPEKTSRSPGKRCRLSASLMALTLATPFFHSMAVYARPAPTQPPAVILETDICTITAADFSKYNLAGLIAPADAPESVLGQYTILTLGNDGEKRIPCLYRSRGGDQSGFALQQEQGLINGDALACYILAGGQWVKRTGAVSIALVRKGTANKIRWQETTVDEDGKHKINQRGKRVVLNLDSAPACLPPILDGQAVRDSLAPETSKLVGKRDTTLSKNEQRAADSCKTLCGPGTELDVNTCSCTPCQEGYYKDRADYSVEYRDICMQKSECGFNSKIIDSGTATSDVTCGCKTGYFQGTSACQSCGQCPAGQHMDISVGGTKTQGAGCVDGKVKCLDCLDGTFSLGGQRTSCTSQKQCQPDQALISGGKVKPNYCGGFCYAGNVGVIGAQGCHVFGVEAVVKHYFYATILLRRNALPNAAITRADAKALPAMSNNVE